MPILFIFFVPMTINQRIMTGLQSWVDSWADSIHEWFVRIMNDSIKNNVAVKSCTSRLTHLSRCPHLRVASKDGLADEVSEVEWVADERHPAEEVGQTEHAQRGRHIDDRHQILLQGDARLLLRYLVGHLLSQRIPYVAYRDWILKIIYGRLAKCNFR